MHIFDSVFSVVLDVTWGRRWKVTQLFQFVSHQQQMLTKYADCLGFGFISILVIITVVHSTIIFSTIAFRCDLTVIKNLILCRSIGCLTAPCFILPVHSCLNNFLIKLLNEWSDLYFQNWGYFIFLFMLPSIWKVTSEKYKMLLINHVPLFTR